ncbi:Inner membrane protein ydcO [Comamonas aquatica]|jgi:benzoate membrane transport protein|uniref:Inner membrane protein ydcO n=2 Tax=Comamonas aquatica TaxID=225991 RepID=A0AA35GHX5_9BURK|nr:Inner membrane protein ydcO [Comamonas aquatica]CAB5662287.1 Inner membrane protein ydcO [Comamonas aquatica]CAC9189667.1 Inner membrane protein ydcO [Comamonas aquatica]CAC9691277.1 Inner membrane protein ydcO [Comamonas aquatica]
MCAMQFFRDFSLSALSAGFVAVLVGVTSSVALVFQAAQAFGATPAQISSWMWALGWGIGLCCAVPSLLLRKPVMVAWSTPGAAVLAAAGVAGGFSMAEAVGAFIVSAALIALCGFSGWFERVMDRIPAAIAAALLAGVLARFGLQVFESAQTALPLVLSMLLTYVLSRRLWPRYAVMLTLVAGIACAAWQGQMQWSQVEWRLALPVFTTPSFTWQACISVALPLFVVTMASQNLPGVAVIRTAGYALPVSRLVGTTGVVTLLLAPFGAFGINLAAITAAICMGTEAHADPAKRYTAAVWCGLFYVLLGIFGAVVAGLLAAFPKELVMAIAGLALLGSIGGGLVAALQQDSSREAALITFLVTLSGVVIAGIGSAFWGVVAGGLTLFVQQYQPWRTKAR